MKLGHRQEDDDLPQQKASKAMETANLAMSQSTLPIAIA